MTMQEFLDTLTAISARGYQPYLVAEAYGQTIRLKSPAGAEHCPITAVYECSTGQTCPPAAVYSTLERLGLESRRCLHDCHGRRRTDRRADHPSSTPRRLSTVVTPRQVVDASRDTWVTPTS